MTSLPRAAARSQADAVLRQAAAIMVSYPDQRTYQRLPLARAALADLAGGPSRTGLLGLVGHLERTPALDMGAHYVRTFDLRRRRTLHLTYYTDGDTRRRGRTLAQLKEVYQAYGWAVAAEELPDHLAVLLEFAARGDAEMGGALLRLFRPGLELLRSALHQRATPYAAALDAVCGTLPPPGRAEWAAAEHLAEAGPPAEEVGLAAYGGAVDLGMPGGPR